MNVSQLLDDYLEHVKMYRSKGTYLWYKKTYKQLLCVLDELGYRDIKDVDKKIFDRIVAYYHQYTNKKNSKINDVISSLVTALKFADVDIPKHYKLKDDTISFTCLQTQDLKRMINYCKGLNLKESNNLYWVLAIYLFIETGVRLSELLDIRKNNIDTELKMIRLLHTKNGYQRIVFYGDMSQTIIKKVMRKTHDYIFEHINQRSLEYFFKKMNRDLQLDERISPHRLRKTFATSMLRHGCPVTTISKLLGHRDIRQTMIYLDIDQLQLMNDYQAFYPYKKED